VYNDITERKRTELALELANKKLNLLSSITRHDILNQISALKGYLALSHGYLGDERTLRDIIDRMDGAVATIEQQIRITKDYKDLGAVPAGWKNVNECITKAMTDLPMQDIQVENDCTNLEIFADPLVEKVFFNLMDNSVGFSSDRMTKIRISCRETVSGLILIYEDNGAGIAPEDKPYLFSRGFRQNTGLGLFLAREILSITGITIQETGERGKGARFEMMVPNGGYRFFRMNH